MDQKREIRSALSPLLEVPLDAILPDLKDGTGPRAPDQGELETMARLLENHGVGAYTELLSDLQEGARVSVIIARLGDPTGYFGRVAVVIWDTRPEIINIMALDGLSAAIVV